MAQGLNRAGGFKSKLEKYGLLEYASALRRMNISATEIAQKCNNIIGEEVITPGQVDSIFRNHPDYGIDTGEAESNRVLRTINILLEKIFDLQGEAEYLLHQAKETQDLREMRESLRLCRDIIATSLNIAKELKEPLQQIQVSCDANTFEFMNKIISQFNPDIQNMFRLEVERIYQKLKLDASHL